jgi:hypothetical protein
VPSLDRYGQSLHDLITMVAELRTREIGFTALHENLDTTTPDRGPQALRTAAVIRLLLHNALRVDEACAADVADLGADAGHRVLRVTRKGARKAKIPLAPATFYGVDGQEAGFGGVEGADAAPRGSRRPTWRQRVHHVPVHRARHRDHRHGVHRPGTGRPQMMAHYGHSASRLARLAKTANFCAALPSSVSYFAPGDMFHRGNGALMPQPQASTGSSLVTAEQLGHDLLM